MSAAVVVLSGGLDSTVLAYRLAQSHDLHLVSIDYGQRHVKELAYAATTAGKLDARHTVVHAPVAAVLPSALTGAGDVPHGHYAADNMRATIVPNRNAILLSIAWGIATAQGADLVAVGCHAGDHPIYPDCRFEFLEALETALRLGTDTTTTLSAPFVARTKGEIVGIGHSLNVPFGDTWSCYEGGGVHCGRCGTCVERVEAFAAAGVADPTIYAEEVSS